VKNKATAHQSSQCFLSMSASTWIFIQINYYPHNNSRGIFHGSNQAMHVAVSKTIRNSNPQKIQQSQLYYFRPMWRQVPEYSTTVSLYN
jgi:hypothetical protein